MSLFFIALALFLLCKGQAIFTSRFLKSLTEKIKNYKEMHKEKISYVPTLPGARKIVT